MLTIYQNKYDCPVMKFCVAIGKSLNRAQINTNSLICCSHQSMG